MHVLDWMVIATYGLVVLGIGAWVSRRKGEDLFLGGRRIPTWAAFCSMVATELSAATFIAVPSAAFKSDWAYMQYAIGSCLARFVLAATLLALYHRQGLTTVYGFLERRFGGLAHRTSAWFFLLGRLLASGARLFVAALAFSVATGLGIEQAILVAGLLASVYTVLGGIRAVIYTDTLQGGVFIVSVLASLVVLHLRGEGLWADWLLAGEAEPSKTLFLHFELSAQRVQELTDAKIPAFLHVFCDSRWLGAALFGGFFLTMATHGTDQDMVQRLLTTSNSRKGGRALILSGLALFPVNIIFLGLGTAIWAWATRTPPAWLPADLGEMTPIQKAQIYPLWVFQEMPVLLRGLVFAGLFAAAMSSLDSALNSLATTWIVDIRKLRKEDPARNREMRLATVVFAALLLAAALACVAWFGARSEKSSDTLVDFALASMTVFYGALLGAFLLGYFSRTRGDDRSVFVALLVGAGIGIFLNLQSAIFAKVWIAWGWNIPFAAAATVAVGALRPSRRVAPDSEEGEAR